MSNSVRPHRRQPTRLPHPWDSSGKNTGVGCHFLLQCTHYYWANSISAWSQATPHPGPAAPDDLSLSSSTAQLSSCQVILLVLHTYPSTQTSPSTHQGRQEIVEVKGQALEPAYGGLSPALSLLHGRDNMNTSIPEWLRERKWFQTHQMLHTVPSMW